MTELQSAFQLLSRTSWAPDRLLQKTSSELDDRSAALRWRYVSSRYPTSDVRPQSGLRKRGHPKLHPYTALSKIE